MLNQSSESNVEVAFNSGHEILTEILGFTVNFYYLN